MILDKAIKLILELRLFLCYFFILYIFFIKDLLELKLE